MSIENKLFSLRKKTAPVILSATAITLVVSGCGNSEPTRPLDKTFPNVLSLKAKPGYEIVEDANGRIWMPNVDKLINGTLPTTVVFETRSIQQNQTRVFNGINAQIIEDKNRNGKADDKDQLVAGGVNGKEVTLKPSTRYLAEIGFKNGGFSFEMPGLSSTPAETKPTIQPTARAEDRRPTPTATTRAEGRPTATPTPTAEVKNMFPIKLSTSAREKYELVEEADGRMWMPNIGSIQGGNEEYKTIFKTRDVNQNMTRRVNAVNARIYKDVNGNGALEDSDLLITNGTNGQEVTLERNTQYIIAGGAKNGGVSLEIVH